MGLLNELILNTGPDASKFCEGLHAIELEVENMLRRQLIGSPKFIALNIALLNIRAAERNAASAIEKLMSLLPISAKENELRYPD